MTDTVTPREVIDPADDKKVEEKEDWKSFGAFLVKLVIIVFLFRTLAFTSFNIPSESMMPRLLVGDYLFAQKWSYGYSRHSLPFDNDLFEGRILSDLPERGDIVIFKHPIDETDYIKRAIGLPGDTIQMIGGVLHIDGTAVRKERIEDFVIPQRPDDGCYSIRFEEEAADGTVTCRYPQYRETLPNGVSYNTFDLGIVDVDNTAPVVVPEGHVFMLGDNRDNSQDSRRASVSGGWVGLVPVENLVAEASFMYWSTDGHSQWSKPWTWFSAARWSRMLRGI